MSDLVALLFGAVIIGFFSYERFNRATYEGRRQLERLVDLLSPDKLRARRVVLHAYLFYALTLLIIYLFLCAYAEVLPLLGGPDIASGTVGASQLPVAPSDEATNPVTGFIPGSGGESVFWAQPLSSAVGPPAARSYFDIGIDASVSLTMALIIVGLAPTFPILQRFEDWLRVAAHRLAGIPTRVLGAGEDLRRKALDLHPEDEGVLPKNSLLIPRGDWERIEHYRRAAEEQLTDPIEFQNDLDLIFAASSWILDRRLKLANASERERFDNLEAELRKRKAVLILELDEKSGYQPGEPKSTLEKTPTDEADGPETAGDGEAGPSEKKRASWERLAAETDYLADDLCILLALYVEHEIIVSDALESQREGNLHSATRQQNLAKVKLSGFLSELLDEHTVPTHLRSYAMLTVLWSLGVTLTFAIVWSVFPGPYETELQRGSPGDPYWRALNYAFTAFNSFGIPIMIALAVRDGGRQSHRWRNMWRAHWTKKLPQAAVLLITSWIIATLFIIGLTLWQAAIDLGGWSANQRTVWTTLRLSFEYNAPTPLRGAVLALIIVTLLDARVAGARSLVRPKTLLSSFLWALSAAAIMAVVGGVTRFLTSWASALSAPVPRQSLDAIDHGLIAYAAIYSALLGFLVVFCVAEALLNQSRLKSTAPKQTVKHASKVSASGGSPAQ